MKFLTLILTFASIAAFSQATPSLVTQPQMDLSTMLNHTQQHVNKLYINLSFYFYFETLIHTTEYIYTLPFKSKYRK
jgi:hypothetical protein